MAVEPAPMEVEKKEEKFYPNFELAQLKAAYERNKTPATLEKIMDIVKHDKMLVFYQKLVEEFGLKADLNLINGMQKEHDTLMKGFETTKADCVENYGDIEIKNAILDKADYLTKIGDMDEAIKSYEEAYEKTVGVGGRMDNVLVRVRIALFTGDLIQTKKYIDMGYEELKKGGDWERKNKLKVYEGMFKIMTREFDQAAELLLASVATFTAVELISFQDFVFYTVLTSMIGLTRADLKSKVTSSPEILSVIHEKAHLKEFLFSFYDCNYRQWTREFIHIIDLFKNDRYFAPHLMKITRSLRLNAYRQFITSYKSVTIKLMAETFGVTPEFIDTEIYDFISQGRLNCKIDKVAKVIETVDDRADQKTIAYKDIIKHGDDLLNQMQKLAAAIDR